MLKDFNDPRHRPITLGQVLEEEREEKRRRKEEQERPIREAEATLNETHTKLYQLEKAEVEAGRPDPSWTLPRSASGLNMSVEAAKELAQTESAAFIAANPDYFPCKKNFEIIVSYLSAQGVAIPTRDCFAQAVERLRHFNLLEERPATPPQPERVEEAEEPNPKDEAPSVDLVDGWDIQTGEPRQYKQAEIWKMSSSELKRAFRMWTERDGTDRRAKFIRNIG